MTIQITAIEQYFSVILFIILYNVAFPTFAAVDKMLKFHHSKLSKPGPVCYVVKDCFNF